jgi:hypothetical protein
MSDFDQNWEVSTNVIIPEYPVHENPFNHSGVMKIFRCEWDLGIICSRGSSS